MKTYCRVSDYRKLIFQCENVRRLTVLWPLPCFAKSFLTAFWELAHVLNARQIATCPLATTLGSLRHFCFFFLSWVAYSFQRFWNFPEQWICSRLGCCMRLQWQGIDLCLKKYNCVGLATEYVAYNLVIFCFIWSMYSITKLINKYTSTVSVLKTPWQKQIPCSSVPSITKWLN